MVSVSLMLDKNIGFTPYLASAMEKYPCTVKLLHNGNAYNLKSALKYELVCDGEEELCALREAEKLICGSGSLCV